MSGEHATRYLARYVYHVALTNHRIESFAHGRVTFRYTHARTHETRRLTLPVDTFLARFLEHVLPRGFTKIRYYGLLRPTGRPALARARHLLELHAAPQAAAGGATTSGAVNLSDGGHATVDAPDACSGGDGDPTGVPCALIRQRMRTTARIDAFAPAVVVASPP